MSGQEVRGMLIRLEATTAQLRQEMAKADSTVAQVSGRIDAQLSRVDSAFDRAGASAQAAAGVLKGALAGVVSVAGISELLKHAEAYTTIANRLKLVTSSAAEFTAAQKAVFDIAQRSGQPLTATAELYQRIATNQKELKLTGQGVAGIVETISKTMVISGASAESANAALIQLGQAFASGTLRGEELNSVLEQAPALAQAIAKGMGVSVGALRALGASGKLTADAVVKALQAQAGAVNDLFGKMQNTVGAATTRLDNSATNLIGKLDQTSGVSQKLAGVLTYVSQKMDAVSKDGASLSDTAANVTTAVERLAYVIGARLVLSLGQATAAFAVNTVESIKRFAATMSSITATNAQIAADGRAAWAAQQSAQAKALDATAALARAKAEVAAAEQEAAADRVRQQSDIARLEMVQAQLIADRELEAQRLKAQISEIGRQQAVARMLELRQAEIAITSQLRTAEQALAETTIATSAAVQAAMEKDVAATAAWAESKMALNKAVAESKRLEEAAGVGTRAFASTATAAGGFLGLLTGPVGMIATVALVAASFIDFGGSADRASKALIDHGLTVDQATEKYKQLSAEQQRYQSDKWVKEQKTSLDAAASDLDAYSQRVMQSLNQINKGNTDYQQQFVQMLAEVKAGTRTLDSVTAWAQDNVKLLPIQVARLTELSAAYAQNTKDAAATGEKINAVSSATAGAAANTEKLAAAQQNSAQSDASRVAYDNYIQQLTKTRDLLGANAQAEAAYALARMNVSDDQRKVALVIAQQTDVLKKYQDAIKQSDAAQQASLKAQLVALYTQQQAAEDSAAAVKKAHEDAAKAAKDSADQQIAQMQRVIDKAINLTSGRNILLLPEQKTPQQNLTGYGLLTNGGTPALPAQPVRQTPTQLAEADIARLQQTTNPNKVGKTDEEKLAARQQKALDEFIAKSKVATQAANDIADAYLNGANSARELTIKQEIENEVLKTGADSYDKVRDAVNAMHDAKDREDVMKRVAELRVENENLLKEAAATLQGQAAIDAFNVAKSVQAELIGKKIDVGSKEYDQLVAATQAQLDNNKAVEQANKANGIVDRLYPQTKLLRDYTEDQAALNKAMELYPEKADAYRDALARLGVEYEQNQRAATAWGQFTEGAVDRIDGAFADMWKSILSKSGNFMDTLKDSFRQFLAELLHMAITKPIIVQFASSLGIGGAAAQSAGLFGAAGGSGAGAGGLLSGASSLYGAVTGWGKAAYTGYQSGGLSGAFGGVGDYFGGALTGINAGAGQLVGTALNGGGLTYAPLSYQFSSGALNGAMTGLAGVGGALYGYSQSGVKGAIAGGVGGAGGAYLGGAAGAAIGSIIPGLGTAIGGAIGTALGGALGSVLGGSLFGGSWQTKDQGISLGVTGGDLSALQFQYQKKKGGLLGSNKKRTRYSALDADTQSALDDSYEATTGAVFDLFDKLNVTLNDGVLDGLNVAATQISTKGKTADQIQEEITKWFAGVADSVTSAINTATGTGLDGYNFQALTAFVNNLYGVNDVFTTLNLKLYDSSVSGGKLAESLSAMAGGLANLQAAASTYYDNFYTDTEKANNVLDAVRKQFSGLDITFPDSREAFRHIVDGLDRTTVAGQQMFVTLTSLAGSAASAYTILEQRATAAEQAAAEAAQKITDALMKGANDAFSALQRSISAAQKAATDAYNARVTSLNDMLSTANAAISDLTSISSTLNSALKSLRGTSDDAVAMLQKQARATLQSALATARSGGSLAGFTGLNDALDTVSNNNTDLYSSLEDFNRDQGRTANVVAELNLLNGKQLTSAEKSAKALQDQLDQAKKAYDAQMSQFDSQLAFAQSQLDALNGVDNSILGVTAAINAMNAAVVAALGGLPSKGAGSGSSNTPGNNSTIVDTLYQQLFGRTPDAGENKYWADRLTSGNLPYSEIAANMLQYASAADKAHAAAIGALPAHATGGLIAGPGTGTSDSIVARLSNGEYVLKAAAVRAFGTDALDQMNSLQIPAFAAGGPVLDIASPSQVYATAAAPAQSAGGNDTSSADVRELVVWVKQVVGAMKVNSDKIQKKLDLWDKDGLPKTTTASASV